MDTGLTSPVIFWVGFLLLAFAPIIRGGNRSVALILLEWLSLILLILLLAKAQRAHASAPNNGVLILALAPLWVGLVQLTPLPASLWSALPGRALYNEALAVVQAPLATYRPLSLTPDSTWVSLLAGIPVTAAFLLAHTCTQRQLAVFFRVLVILALIQAVLGLLQRGPFPELSFGALRGETKMVGRSIGSFANPNHFASYITMTIPVAILLLGQAVTRSQYQPSLQSRWQSTMPMWSVALFILFAAILASNSRGAAVSCVIVTSLSMLLCLQRNRSTRTWLWVTVGSMGLLGLVALMVGINSLLFRFTSDQAGYLAGDRGLELISSWRAALEFWPVGSGLGSFAAVYPRFQPAELHGFIEYAHNDYVQLLMECGLLFVGLMTMAMVLLGQQIVLLVRRFRMRGLDGSILMPVSCGLGVLGVLLHSWVDFNLRIPSNAMLAAFLFGAFLRPLPPRSRASALEPEADI